MDEELGFNFRYRQFGEGAIMATHKHMLADFRGLQEALLGPVGVATGLALAGAKLLDFAEAGAVTAEQKNAFAAFNAEINATKATLGEAAAEAVTSSGALDFLGDGAGQLGETIGALLKILEPLSPLFDVLSLSIKAGALPTTLLASGIEYLSNELGSVMDLLWETSDATEDVTAEINLATTAFFSLDRAQKEVNATVAGHIRLREQEARAIKTARAEAQRAHDTEEQRQARMATAVAIARKGVDAVRMNEDAVRAAIGDLNKAMLQREYILSNTLQGTPEYTRAEAEYKQAWQDWADVAGAVEGLESRLSRGRETLATVTREAAQDHFDYADAMRVVYEAAVADGPALLAFFDDYADRFVRVRDAQARMVAQQKALDAVIKKSASDTKAATKATDERLARSELDLQMEALRAKSYRDTAAAAYDGAKSVMEAAGVGGAFKATLGLLEETALAGMAFASGNWPEFAAHTSNLAAWVAMQAFAESAGGSASSGSAAAGGASASLPSAGPTDELAARQSGDRPTQTVVVLEADGREWARGTAEQLNAGERYGVRLSPGIVGETRQGWLR